MFTVLLLAIYLEAYRGCTSLCFVSWPSIALNSEDKVDKMSVRQKDNFRSVTLLSSCISYTFNILSSNCLFNFKMTVEFH